MWSDHGVVIMRSRLRQISDQGLGGAALDLYFMGYSSGGHQPWYMHEQCFFQNSTSIFNMVRAQFHMTA